MHFSQAVASVQSMVGSVKGVQILYSDKVHLLLKILISEKVLKFMFETGPLECGFSGESYQRWHQAHL